MSNVDPFIIELPLKIVNDPELRPYFEYLNRFLHDTWVRTGGGVDLFETIVSSETFETSSIGAEFQEIADDNEQIEDQIFIPGPIWEAHIATTEYTATDKDMVEGRNNVTIKLDKFASHNEQIITGNGDGSTITIDGDGVQIRYKGERGSKINIRNEGTFIHWFKFITETEEYWRAA